MLGQRVFLSWPKKRKAYLTKKKKRNEKLSELLFSLLILLISLTHVSYFLQ